MRKKNTLPPNTILNGYINKVMLSLIIYTIFCLSENDKSNNTSSAIMEQLRNGKKFSEIADTSIFQHFTEFHADRFIEILNNINVPKRSCYNEILYELQFDCEKANEEQQRILALRFTQCYYNITGKLDLFPTGYIDELKTSKMSQSVYSVYTSMKAHWKNLCQFSKQNIFTEQTSHSLIDLYQTIIESMNSILSLKEELKETSHFFNESFNNMTVQINKTAKNVEDIQALFESFTGYFDSIQKFIKYASTTLNQMKFFSLIIIIALLFAMYIPKMLIPVSILTILFGCIDRYLGNYFQNWNNSFYRLIFKYVYAFICFSYPALLIFRYITKLAKFIFSLIKGTNENQDTSANNHQGTNKPRNENQRQNENNNQNEDKSNNRNKVKDDKNENSRKRKKTAN